MVNQNPFEERRLAAALLSAAKLTSGRLDP
jgi:hypothetical protein